MKNKIEILLFIAIASTLITCKKDFLYEKSPLLEHNTDSIQSFIVVLPDQKAENCPLVFKNKENLKFKITEKPDWLILESNEGVFKNDTAWIKCSAKKVEAFSKVGIYYDGMQIEDENGEKYIVQVAYVNEGNPKIEVPEEINFNNYDTYNNYCNFLIRNNADGILIWEIVECPEWLFFTNEIYYPSSVSEVKSGIIAPNDAYYLVFCFRPTENMQQQMSGEIVIASNDKNNPRKVIKVDVDFGVISISIYNKTLNFDKNITNLDLEINTNVYPYGILTWEFIDLPKWLSCDRRIGYHINQWSYSFNIRFYVNRELLADGITTATIYLRSNYIDNPNIPITIKVTK